MKPRPGHVLLAAVAAALLAHLACAGLRFSECRRAGHSATYCLTMEIAG